MGTFEFGGKGHLQIGPLQVVVGQDFAFVVLALVALSLVLPSLAAELAAGFVLAVAFHELGHIAVTKWRGGVVVLRLLGEHLKHRVPDGSDETRRGALTDLIGGVGASVAVALGSAWALVEGTVPYGTAVAAIAVSLSFIVPGRLNDGWQLLTRVLQQLGLPRSDLVATAVGLAAAGFVIWKYSDLFGFVGLVVGAWFTFGVERERALWVIDHEWHQFDVYKAAMAEKRFVAAERHGRRAIRTSVWRSGREAYSAGLALLMFETGRRSEAIERLKAAPGQFAYRVSVLVDQDEANVAIELITDGLRKKGAQAQDAVDTLTWMFDIAMYSGLPDDVWERTKALADHLDWPGREYLRYRATYVLLTPDLVAILDHVDDAVPLKPDPSLTGIERLVVDFRADPDDRSEILAYAVEPAGRTNDNWVAVAELYRTGFVSEMFDLGILKEAWEVVWQLHLCLHHDGLYQEALIFSERALIADTLSERVRAVMLHNRACSYVQLGDYEAALDELELVPAARIGQVAEDEELEPLVGFKRFQALLERADEEE